MAQARVTGRCQCGACTYEVEGPRPPVYACHCLECQRQSASAFGLSMPVARERLKLSGEFGCYTRPTDSGSRTHCYFCRNCGSRVYHQSERSADFVTLKGGTLEDPSVLDPVAHIWVSRKQPWVLLDPAIPTFATQPGDLKAWRALIDKEPDDG
jgi:hypothetical protein